MTNRFPPALVVLATVGLLLLFTASAAAGSHAVPFKADFSGTATTSQSSSSFVGAGNASHMGHITTNGVADGFRPDSSCPGGVANTNTETLTAANGDTLTITSQDVACPTAPGVYHGTGQWTVTGGTGRFSGAGGQGSYDGSADFNAHTFTIDLTGTLVMSSGALRGRPDSSRPRD